MIEGVFLYYYSETPYSEQTEALLKKLELDELDIRMVPATHQTVSSLIPYTLQQGAKSWLILFHPEYRQELLILPFDFDGKGCQSLLDMLKKIKQLLLNLPQNAHRFRFRLLANLRLYASKRLGRFEQLLINVPIDDVLIDPLPDPPLQQEEGSELREILFSFQEIQEKRTETLISEISELREILFSFRKTTQEIQEKRTETLISVLSEEGDFIRHLDFDDKLSSAIRQFDDELLRAVGALLKSLTRLGSEVVPQIVKKDFKDIMDSETKRFLITAETVGEFAKNHQSALVNFDYSVPGCGLWKAVELELNLSLILHLRRSEGVVANVKHPWKKNASANGELLILTGKKASVDLSEQSKNRLKGITLGPMEFICRWAHCNTVREKLGKLSFPKPKNLEQFLKGLAKDLKDIRTLRNGHAHISAMSETKFGELHELVLSKCLLKVLELKKVVFDHWKGDL